MSWAWLQWPIREVVACLPACLPSDTWRSHPLHVEGLPRLSRFATFLPSFLCWSKLEGLLRHMGVSPHPPLPLPRPSTLELPVCVAKARFQGWMKRKCRPHQVWMIMQPGYILLASAQACAGNRLPHSGLKSLGLCTALSARQKTGGGLKAGIPSLPAPPDCCSSLCLF